MQSIRGGIIYATDSGGRHPTGGVIFGWRVPEGRVRALKSRSCRALKGDIGVPGDKSISHRALMIGALAIGETSIRGLSAGEDVRRTAAALTALGVAIEEAGGVWRVLGVGTGGLAEPRGVLDLGNSGTAARLLIGILATHPLTAHLTGDESLCSRPMARVVDPIEHFGAQVLARTGGRLPLAVIGAADPVPVSYRLPVPSAQVKSAILLAGLNAPGETTVTETQPTRDHTELMLRHFGAEIGICDAGEGGRAITLKGQPELAARDISVPGDPSAAAFPGVAALIVPRSEVTIRNVGINPLRAGLFETLREMGADITISNRAEDAGEPAADITFRTSALNGIVVPAERAPSMIDEYPILAVAAAVANGPTRMLGLAELRIKESNRLQAIVDGLKRCGITVAEDGDGLAIEGRGGPPPGGATIASRADHRIAMSFLVLGMAAESPVGIDDGVIIGTSFPGFTELMNGLGAAITTADDAD